MSDPTVYPIYESWSSLNYTSLLDDKWTVDAFGFPDIRFLVDAVVRYPKESVHKCMIVHRKHPIICKYPEEITLDGDGN